jgi:amino acid transporter
MAVKGDFTPTPAGAELVSRDPASDEQTLLMQADNDERVIVALGYKQEFKREFTLWTTFSVSFSVLGLLPSTASTLSFGKCSMPFCSCTYHSRPIAVLNGCLRNGVRRHGGNGMGMDHCHDFHPMRGNGRGGALFFNANKVMGGALPLSVHLPIGSDKLRSGGLYYAAAVLAPPGYGPFAAWLTGWSNWLAQVTAAPAVNYATARMILAAGTIYSPAYAPRSYEIFLVTALLMVTHGLLSSMPTKWIARFNSYGLTINMICLFLAIIAIPAGSTSFNSAGDVWCRLHNGTPYPDGVALLMSFVGVIWTMSGYDSPFHLSEECANANIASPRAIVLTSAVGGVMGWVLQLVIAYTVQDIEAVLTSSVGQPWASFLFQVLPEKTALAILALTIVCGFSMGQGCMIAASRVTYAYARDDCFPLSHIWKQVNRHTQTPVNAVWFNCGIGLLLTVLIFAGEVAVGALFSVGAIASFVGFAIPIGIRVFVIGDRFRAGPWHLGEYGRVIGAAGVLFVTLMLPILCLPAVTGSELT